MTKNIAISDSLARELNMIRVSNACSYSDAIRLLGTNQACPRARINDLFNDIKDILMPVYNGDSEIMVLWLDLNAKKAELLKAMTRREHSKVLPGQEELL